MKGLFSDSGGVSLRNLFTPRAYEKTPQSADQRVQALGGCCFFGDDVRHGPMFGERPRLPYGDIASSGRRHDLPPRAMGRGIQSRYPWNGHRPRRSCRSHRNMSPGRSLFAFRQAYAAATTLFDRAIRRLSRPTRPATLLNRCRTARRA